MSATEHHSFSSHMQVEVIDGVVQPLPMAAVGEVVETLNNTLACFAERDRLQIIGSLIEGEIARTRETELSDRETAAVDGAVDGVVNAVDAFDLDDSALLSAASQFLAEVVIRRDPKFAGDAVDYVYGDGLNLLLHAIFGPAAAAGIQVND